MGAAASFRVDEEFDSLALFKAYCQYLNGPIIDVVASVHAAAIRIQTRARIRAARARVRAARARRAELAQREDEIRATCCDFDLPSPARAPRFFTGCSRARGSCSDDRRTAIDVLVETRAAPGRSEALAGLKSTPKRDMSEIMCFVKPPRAMSILATVVCLLVGGDRLSASQFEKKLAKLQKLEDKKKLGWQEFRRLSDPYWALFKRFDAINLSVLPFRCVRCAAQHLFKSNNRWASFRNDLIKCWGPGPPLYDCVASVLRAAALHQLSREWAAYFRSSMINRHDELTAAAARLRPRPGDIVQAALLLPKPVLFHVLSYMPDPVYPLELAWSSWKPLIKARFQVGDKVEARCRGGRRWYPGRIVKVHRDGTYDFHYDYHEEEECGVEGRLVRETTVRDSSPRAPTMAQATPSCAACGGAFWLPHHISCPVGFAAAQYDTGTDSSCDDVAIPEAYMVRYPELVNLNDIS